MEMVNLRLEGLKLIRPKVFHDKRGFFLESYSQPLFDQLGFNITFPQDNHSYSQKDTLRGMHFQSQPGQAKLIRVASGTIYDVVVDIRPQSPSFGEWEAVILDGEKHHQLFIPVGFAHGFCVLSPTAHVLYKVSTLYDAMTEKGFRWDDPEVNIQWPIHNPIVSERDQHSPYFRDMRFR